VTGSSPHETSALGMLFYGVEVASSTPFLGGTLCVAGHKVRTSVQNSTGNPPPSDCSGTFSLDFLDWQATGLDPTLIEGTQVDAQS
jgi:hypothetical protein